MTADEFVRLLMFSDGKDSDGRDKDWIDYEWMKKPIEILA